MPGSSGWTSCIQVYCHMLLSPLVILTSPHSHLQNSTLHTHPSKYTTHSHSHTQHPATMVSKVLALTCMAGLAGMANARSLSQASCAYTPTDAPSASSGVYQTKGCTDCPLSNGGAPDQCISTTFSPAGTSCGQISVVNSSGVGDNGIYAVPAG